jgi:hypothetical protein
MKRSICFNVFIDRPADAAAQAIVAGLNVGSTVGRREEMMVPVVSEI